MIRMAAAGRCPDELSSMLRDSDVDIIGTVGAVGDLEQLAPEPHLLVCFTGTANDDLAELICAVAGRCFIVVVGCGDRSFPATVIPAGADAYLVRKHGGDDAVLVSMILAAVLDRSGPPGGGDGVLARLSQRERETLAYVAAGFTHQQTATRMHVAKSTVDTFIARIRAKLGVGNKAELTTVAAALRPGSLGRGRAGSLPAVDRMP